MLTIQEIREIINMIDQSSIQKFELEHAGSKIVIVKNELIATEPTITKTDSLKEDHNVENAGCLVARKIDEASVKMVEKRKEATALQKIVAPMVGTFYAAQEPGAEPFVKIGEKVTTNTVVCILEAMKLFHELEAGINGEIVEILLKDGEFAEYGQPLFLVKPA
jgi:acetyl-CoA carboxylase biotin carboxyl carrier protein